MLDLMKKLEEVQELDLVIDKVVSTKNALPQRLAQFELDIKTRSAKRVDLAKKLDELTRADNQQRGVLELNDSRAKRSQERLTGVKTGDEYQALQKELEGLKKSTLAVQDAQTKLRDEMKKIEGEMQAIDTGLNEVKSKMAEEQSKIDAEAGGANKNLDELQTKRKTLVGGIEGKYLNAYDKVRSTKGGMGIALVAGGVCKGCNMRLMPQLYVELQRLKEVHTCPTCRRILIYRPATAQA